MHVLILIVGLCIGSFLNVCIYRIPENESIVKGRSRCPRCETQLKGFDMIPVLSFIILQGKCRSCKNPISIQYPIIEAITGIEFLLLYMKYGYTIEFLGMCLLASLLSIVFLIDFRYMIIPNEIVVFGIIVGVFIQIYSVITDNYSIYSSKFDGIIAAGLAVVILASVYTLSVIAYKGQEGIGMGDIKLYIPIGLFLGWKLTLMSLWVAIIMAGIVSVILLLLKKVNRKSAIPFGPFIVIGILASIFFETYILTAIL